MDKLVNILEYISLGIGLIAVVIILWSIIRGIIELVSISLTKDTAEKPRLDMLSKVRHDISYHLLIALEFLIAADIVRTIIKPSLGELSILGAIVAIRVVLSYFLHREIDHKTV
jgi:uncharacterized membrane protein